MNKRCIMRIEVFPGVPELLGHVTDSVGSTQVSVTSRLLEWFAQQPDVIQAAILGLYPHDIKKELPRMILERMGADKSNPKHVFSPPTT